MYYYPDQRTYYDPEALGYEYTSHDISVTENDSINYWYFPSESERTRAVVLHFHGNAQNISSHFLLSAWLVRHDYDVMIFDYRGYGASTGKPSPENTYHDGLAALKEAHRRAQSKNVPLIVFAQSLGGAVALRALVDFGDTEDVALVVADSTFYSYKSIVRKKARKLLFYPLSSFVALFFSNEKSPSEALPRKDDFPVLVMHSRNDPVVEFENGRELFEALKPPRKFHEIESSGHLSWSEHGRSSTDRILLDYLDAAVKSYGAGDPDPFEQQ